MGALELLGSLAALAVAVLPWVAMYRAGGYDHDVWRAAGRSKAAWFIALLLVHMLGWGPDPGTLAFTSIVRVAEETNDTPASGSGTG